MDICSICKKYDINDEFQSCEEFNCRYKRTIQIDKKKMQDVKMYCLELIHNNYVKIKKTDLKKIINILNGEN